MWKEWLKIELLRKFLKESQEEEDCSGGQEKDGWTMLRRTSGRWRSRVENREEWAVIVREAKALHGL
jgi:hypothetical protein